MTSPDSVTRAAPAKVNLLLRVLGERSDGFHDIETLFQAVGLHDDVEVALADGGGVGLEVAGADLGPATSNLAYRAAAAVLEAAGSRQGMQVRLEKRIPAGAGLGGGSSDAAAVLLCANALLGEPLDATELAGFAAELGSDVPFFLGESTLALGTGRGQLLEALMPLPVADLVLVLPPVHVSTAWAYGALDERRRGGGEAPCLGLRGDAPRDWREVADLAGNDFEAVAAAMHPEVATSLDALRASGAAPALLSGSGSACYGIFSESGVAVEVARALSLRLGWPALAARTLREWPPASGRWSASGQARP